jgi:hypothetical protein
MTCASMFDINTSDPCRRAVMVAYLSSGDPQPVAQNVIPQGLTFSKCPFTQHPSLGILIAVAKQCAIHVAA